MRYALIMAGGSGTRLWPMSRQEQPKQLIPFINGKSLLAIAVERLNGLVPQKNIFICAGEHHKDAILNALPDFDEDRYLAEPEGRDTLNAVGYSAAVIDQLDDEATMAVFTADHIIEPVSEFQSIVERGYALAEHREDVLVTFGISPRYPATGYGYLALGEPISDDARKVDEFKEKPDHDTAQKYLDAGSEKYLWNSGMFVWRTKTMVDCVRRFAPENYEGLNRIAEAWQTDKRWDVLREVYPTLKKISIDYAVMEPASRDDQVKVAAIPMPLDWLDVGSWPSFADTCETDENDNALAAKKHVLLNTRNTLVASETDDHLIATIGCEDMIVIHTPKATLVCRADQADELKTLYNEVKKQYGEDMV